MKRNSFAVFQLLDALLRQPPTEKNGIIKVTKTQGKTVKNSFIQGQICELLNYLNKVKLTAHVNIKFKNLTTIFETIFKYIFVTS